MMRLIRFGRAIQGGADRERQHRGWQGDVLAKFGVRVAIYLCWGASGFIFLGFSLGSALG